MYGYFSQQGGENEKKKFRSPYEFILLKTDYIYINFFGNRIGIYLQQNGIKDFCVNT